MGLKRKSVIEELGDGSRRIVMHDLWHEFAATESRIGEREHRRCVYDVIDIPSVRSEESGVIYMRFGGGWVNLQRICMMRTGWNIKGSVRYSYPHRNMKESYRTNLLQILKSCIWTRGPTLEYLTVDELNFSCCSNVTVLKLVKVRLAFLDLSALRHLRSLECDFGTDDLTGSNYSLPGVEVRGLGVLSDLVVLLLHEIPPHSSWIEEISSLTKLQILRLESRFERHGNKYPDLKRLWYLLHVTITGFRNRANTISGFNGNMSNLRILDLSECSFSRCPGLGDLVALEELDLEYCWKLKELPNLQRLTKLRRVDIWGCYLIRALPGFDALVVLEKLQANYCRKLAELPDLRKLIHLQALDLRDCPVSALIGLENAISLREIDVRFKGLDECHDLQMLRQLRKVEVSGWSSGGLPCLSSLPKLEQLRICECEGLDVLTGLPNLTSLLVLNIFNCGFKDVSCVSHFSTLRDLRIRSCKKLERLPDIHKLTRLERLEISECKSLRIWEGLRGSRLLERSMADYGSGDWVFPC